MSYSNGHTALHLGEVQSTAESDALHGGRLQGAHSAMDELIGAGQAALDGLRSQHISLKGARRKVLDIANQLGLSGTVLRLIETRTTQDKYVLFAGMAVTSLLMVLFYLWWTRF